MEKKTFKTEVSQLLDLIINSLYSHKEIFLRELISNSSDALDKLKYESLQGKAKADSELRIDLEFNESEKTITLSDNGIGMTKDELVDNLGTIASSGTRKFLASLNDEQKKDSNLIGQFGVGFYSAFMVADKVDVISKSALEENAQAYIWSSDGKEKYSIDEAQREGHGTTLILHLKEEGKEFASRWKLSDLIKRYSDHIAYPIYLAYDQKNYDKDGKETGSEHKVEKINSAAALWRRPKASLKPEDYNEFYKNTSYDSEDPLFYIHTQAEGVTEYTTLFFIPAKAPFDMYHADYKPGVKLYVKRVYITDDEKELLPTYLRFVKGVIDSEDLPLNVSREILQQNKVMSAIRTASVKKILSEFKKISESNAELYDKFIAQYNRPLKEGLYSDYANRDELLELVRFHSTAVDGYTSLAAYKERMGENAKSIYYLTGTSLDAIKNSPLLKMYKDKGFEVLLGTDDIDDFVIGTIGTYKDLPLKAINKSGAVEDFKTEEEKKEDKKSSPIIEKLKKALGESVKDVVISNRLTDASAVVVVDDNDMSVQMQQIMKAMGNSDMPLSAPILEINSEDPVVRKIEESTDEAFISDAAFVLLDQAMLAEGVMPKDPALFSKRLHSLLAR
ncbi:MAG: molecular chaperone HtpG [Sphaerochaetaceae bacterium]|jgi:molecular chaperone HtpG|nr:molecular chaperone HtpG [Sphaerochaetaceae bacterium]